MTAVLLARIHPETNYNALEYLFFEPLDFLEEEEFPTVGNDFQDLHFLLWKPSLLSILHNNHRGVPPHLL